MTRPGDRKRRYYKIRIDDGHGGIMHGSICGAFGPPCVYCGDISTALCDGKIGVRKLCSRPLCYRCAPTVGADTNYCRDHVPSNLQILPPKPPTMAELRARAGLAPIDTPDPKAKP